MKVFLFQQRTSAVFFLYTRYWKHIQYVTVSVREEIQTELVYHLKLVVYPYILSSEYANIHVDMERNSPKRSNAHTHTHIVLTLNILL